MSRDKNKPLNKIKYLVGLLLLLFSCSENQSQLQGKWIERYNLVDGKMDVGGNSTILNFDKDSLEIRNFFIENHTKLNAFSSVKFKIEDEHVLLEYSDRIDSLKISSMTTDSLVLKYETYETVYSRMDEYNLENRNTELKNILNNSLFYFSTDSTEIEFLDNNIYVLSELNKNLTIHHLWGLQNYDGELFLVLDGVFNGFILQAKEINNKKAVFKFYTNRISDLEIIAVEKPETIDTEKLIGDWVQDISELPMPPFELNETKDEFYFKEVLKITKKDLIRRKFNRSDTLKYSLNSQKNKLLFFQEWHERWKRQWNVVKLDDNEMVIERLNWRQGGAPKYGHEVEVISYKRSK